MTGGLVGGSEIDRSGIAGNGCFRAWQIWSSSELIRMYRWPWVESIWLVRGQGETGKNSMQGSADWLRSGRRHLREVDYPKINKC